MASTDIRDFNFYAQYIWQHTDFENFQKWTNDKIQGLAEGAFGKSVLTGLTVSPNGGLQVAIAAGIAVNANGRLLVVPSTQTATFSSPVGNPARSLVVLRPKDTDTDSIQEPTNPLNTVPLTTILGYEIVVISGTPAASPQYPSPQSGDVVLMGVKLSAGHATITEADFEIARIDVPRKPAMRIRQVASDYQATVDDEIIEVAATGGNVTVTLPTAATMRGRDISVVKIDSATGSVIVDGQGSEQISGQNTQEIEDQWGSVSCYSIGSAWRSY